MHALVQNPTDLDPSPSNPVCDVVVLYSVESNVFEEIITSFAPRKHRIRRHGIESLFNGPSVNEELVPPPGRQRVFVDTFKVGVSLRRKNVVHSIGEFLPGFVAFKYVLSDLLGFPRRSLSAVEAFKSFSNLGLEQLALHFHKLLVIGIGGDDDLRPSVLGD